MADTEVRDKVLNELRDEEIIAFTQQMIRFESRNGHEGPIARWLADEFRAMGLQVTVEDVHDGRLNVIALLPGAEERIGLLFHGHTDTVPFLNMENPLSGDYFLFVNRVRNRAKVLLWGFCSSSLKL